MNLMSKEKAGEWFIISNALISSLFPVLTKISLRTLSPMASLAWSMLFAFIFFTALNLFRHSWHKILDRKVLPWLIGTAIILGIIFPTLQFLGLKYTSAGNAGIILSFEVFFTFIFYNVWRREYIDKKHIVGALLMMISGILILLPSFSHFRKGDFLILLAVMLPPIANLFQKRARESIGSEGILLFRTIVAVPVLFMLAFVFERNNIPSSSNIWLVLILNGFIYFGISKVLWIEGIHRISITKSAALNSITPAFTLIFAFVLLKDIPTGLQLLAVPPTILGIYLLTRPIS